MPRNDPQEHLLNVGAHGHYRLCQPASLIATQQATPKCIFSLRWGDLTRTMIIHRIRLETLQIFAFTTSQELMFQMSKLSAYTVADTGGTSILSNLVPTKASYPATLVSDCRISSASAAGITAGTRTVVPGVILNDHTFQYAALPNPIPRHDTEWNDSDSTSSPFVLNTNEGLQLVLDSAIPAAGTVLFTISMDWSEVDAY